MSHRSEVSRIALSECSLNVFVIVIVNVYFGGRPKWRLSLPSCLIMSYLVKLSPHVWHLHKTSQVLANEGWITQRAYLTDQKIRRSKVTGLIKDVFKVLLMSANPRLNKNTNIPRTLKIWIFMNAHIVKISWWNWNIGS